MNKKFKYIKEFMDFELDYKLDTEMEFNDLSKIVEDTVVFSSDPYAKVELNEYKEIIKMGKDVIPFLLEKMKTDKKIDWIPALNIITNFNPVKEINMGNIDLMAKDWIKWGNKNGYRR